VFANVGQHYVNIKNYKKLKREREREREINFGIDLHIWKMLVVVYRV
jgi:hypothetical protein